MAKCVIPFTEAVSLCRNSFPSFLHCISFQESLLPPPEEPILGPMKTKKVFLAILQMK